MNSLPRPASRAFSIPDPTPVLFLAAAALALLWAADYGTASLAIAGTMAIPFLLFQLSANRMLAAAALIVASVMPRFFLELSTFKARPEHIAVGTLALLIPFWSKRTDFRPTWILADSMLVAYAGCNLFSSFWGSPGPSQTMRWAVQQAIVIAPYFLLRLLISDREMLRRIFRILLAVGTVEAAYTVVCFFSGLIFGTKFGMEQDAYGAVAAPYGTQYEPNIVGSYCGATMIMLLVIYFNRPSKKLLGAIAITTAAVMLSLSRAAVASVLIATIITFAYGLRLEAVRKGTLLKAGLAVLVAWLAVAPAITAIYRERLSTVSVTEVSEEDTLAGRLLVNALALNHVLEHPLLGTGTASFQLMDDVNQIPGFETVWIGNPELRIMHDTGAVGLAVFLCFLFFLVRSSLRLFKRKPFPELAALLLGGIVYCIAFQATEGTLLAFSWVHLGLIGCAIALCRGDVEKASAEGEPESQTSR